MQLKADIEEHLILHALYKEFITCHSESSHQHNKLLKVHLSISVLIQIRHDLLHNQGVFTRLQQDRDTFTMFFQLCTSAINVNAT